MHAFLKSLAWLEPVVELLRLGIFLVFLAMLTAYAWSRGEERRRRWARLIVAYVAVITTAIGIIQIDAWPFTNWALVHTLRKTLLHSYEIEGVDAAGRTWTVDKSIFQPMAQEEIAASLGEVPAMDEQGKRDIARWLYDRVERSRERVLRGEAFPPNDYLFGSLSAPYHFEVNARWRKPSDVPPQPFRIVRMVFITWDINDRERRGDAAIERQVIIEERR